MFGYLVAKMLPILPRSFVQAVAKRYVAGEDIASALEKVASLNATGFLATMDVLGEDVEEDRRADNTVDEYINCLNVIQKRRLHSNISLKLSHLGVRGNPDKAKTRLFKILEQAQGYSNFVRIDMEDSSLTDITLKIYREARLTYPNVGCVLQSYLRRTREDARALAKEGANVRLCKGIYREPKSIAFHDKEDIRNSYISTAQILLSEPNTYVGFATHDKCLVERCLELIEKMGVTRDRIEFQALLGVPVEEMLHSLIKQGIKVRIYVPFGKEWYGYSLRRLKENPKIATYVVKHLLRVG